MGGVARPIHHGTVTAQFVPVILLLGFTWIAEFMDFLPQIVRPQHLRGLRRYIVKRMNVSTFAEAFHALIVKTDRFSARRGWKGTFNTFVLFEGILAHYLYFFHRDDYFWSIHGGLHTGVPAQHTCPSLRPAKHISKGRCKHTGTKRLDERADYFKHAST